MGQLPVDASFSRTAVVKEVAKCSGVPQKVARQFLTIHKGDPDEALVAIAVCIADAVEALTVEYLKPEDARNQERMGNLIRILE